MNGDGTLSLSPPVFASYGIDVKDAEKVASGVGRSAAEGWGTRVIPIGASVVGGFLMAAGASRRRPGTNPPPVKRPPPAPPGFGWLLPGFQTRESAALKVM